MGAKDSARASLRASLITVPVLQAQFLSPCMNMVSSDKSDGDLRAIVVDFPLSCCRSSADLRRRRAVAPVVTPAAKDMWSVSMMA